jgi:hypothetical protein
VSANLTNEGASFLLDLATGSPPSFHSNLTANLGAILAAAAVMRHEPGVRSHDN